MSLIQTIAEQAGVSTSTVIRALNCTDDYQRPFYARRAERIRALAEELGYRPNAAARAVRTGRFGSVCLLTSAEPGTGHLPGVLISHLCSSSHEAGLMLSVARLPDAELTDRRQLPAILRRTAADGLLINYPHAAPPAMEAILAEQGLPAVWLNTKRPVDAVTFRNRKAGREITRRLIATGHQRIAFFAPTLLCHGRPWPRHYSIDDRLVGYRTALREANLEAIIWTPEIGEDWTLGREIDRLFGSDQPPTAILAMLNSESIVVGALRRGLRVPEDVSVCAFTHAVGNGRGLPTAACLLPDWEMARRSVAMLQRRIATPQEPCKRESVVIPLVRPHFLYNRRERTE